MNGSSSLRATIARSGGEKCALGACGECGWPRRDGPEECWREFPELGCRRLGESRRETAGTWTLEDLFSELKRIAVERGMTPRSDECKGMCSAFRKRGLSWNQAVLAAGLEPRKKLASRPKILPADIHR